MTRPKIIVHNHFTGDNWYHAGQVNGYYILEGAVGDKGRWIVRNGKYDIVKNAGSKAEAVNFAKKAQPGGATAQAADADDPITKKHLKLVGSRYEDEAEARRWAEHEKKLKTMKGPDLERRSGERPERGR